MGSDILLYVNTMEKYYISRLDDIDYSKRIKLIEITYSRKAPSFGLTYFSLNTQQLHLKVLDFSDNNEAIFIDSKRSQKPKENVNVIDYDICDSLSLDHPVEYIQCIVLTTGSNSINKCDLLKNGGLVELDANINIKDGPLLSCYLKCSDAICYIHLLTSKSYILLSSSSEGINVKQVNRYSLSESTFNHLSFKTFNAFSSNTEYVLLELSDQSYQVFNSKDGCSLINIDLEVELNSKHFHFLFPTGILDNFLCLFHSRNLLTAYSISLNQETIHQKDPDKLLEIPQNTIEVEKCWTIDCDAIESLRRINEELFEEPSAPNLCVLCSSIQASGIDKNPMFLAVMLECNLLIYKFETTLTSSSFVAYDRFFKIGDESPSLIDYRVQPGLVQNFRLTGSQPTDALWNTIFSTSGQNTRPLPMHHFKHMNLLISLTSSGDLIGFRLESDEIPAKKEDVYQQHVAKSIRGSSRVLLNAIDQLESCNKKLIQDFSKNTSLVPQDGTQNKSQLDLVSTTLIRRDDFGSKYSLNISISDLVQVSKIVITSSLNSSFNKPVMGGIFIDSINIDNNYNSSQLGTLVADADPNLTSFHQRHVKDIEAYVSIDLKPGIKSISLVLPVIIMDGKPGVIRVHFLMSDGDSNHVFNTHSLFKELSIHKFEEHLEYHSPSEALICNLQIRTLHSYRVTETQNFKYETSEILKITGSFLMHQMMSWLNKCMDISWKKQRLDIVEMSLFSSFTYCYILLRIQDNQLEISSDDMFAKEILRKQILEDATSESIKLIIDGNQQFKMESLNHLFRLQYLNLQHIFKIANKLNNYRCSKENQLYAMLIELLNDEMNMDEYGEEFPSDCGMSKVFDEDIRTDIKNLAWNKTKEEEKADEEEENDDYTFRSVVCSYILDCLADFDRYQGKRVDEEKLVSMEAKLVSILSDKTIVTMDSFQAHIQQAWQSLG